jgi:arsenate reductase-like glutaredoxin family protein
VEGAPVGREETLGLARAAREIWVKAGSDVRHFGADDPALREAELIPYLVHEDGWMRVPVLVAGPLLVRGYTEALYRRALLGKGEP